MDFLVPALASGGSLNPLDFDPSAFMLTLIVFLILFGLLLKFGWNPILDALDAREKRISDAIASAENAKREAERLLAEHKKSVADTERLVAARLEEGRKMVQKQADDLMARAQADAAAERERVRKEIEGEKVKALSELRSEPVRLSRLVAEKSLGRQIDENDHRRLANDVLAALK